MSAPNIGIAAVEKLPNPFALEDSPFSFSIGAMTVSQSTGRLFFFLTLVLCLNSPFEGTDLATRQISTANSPTSGGNGSLAPNGVGNLRVKSDVMPRPSSARTRKIHRKTEDEQNRRKQQLLLQRLGQTSDVPGLAGEGSALGDEYSKQQDSAPFAGDAERTRLLYEDDESDDGCVRNVGSQDIIVPGSCSTATYVMLDVCSWFPGLQTCECTQSVKLNK